MSEARNKRRVLGRMGLLKKTETVQEYTGDTVDAPLAEVSRPAEDPRVEVVLMGVDPRPLARPGQSGKLKIYKDPNFAPPEDEPDAEAPNVRAYRRHAHSVMYIGTNGIREYMPPPANAPPLDAARYEADFDRIAKAENLRLLTRQERREMWRAEKQRLEARKKRQKEEVARILAEAGAND